MRAANADLAALTRVDTRVRQRTYSITMVTHYFMLALMRGELAEAERRIMELMRLQRHFDRARRAIERSDLFAAS